MFNNLTFPYIFIFILAAGYFLILPKVGVSKQVKIHWKYLILHEMGRDTRKSKEWSPNTLLHGIKGEW